MVVPGTVTDELDESFARLMGKYGVTLLRLAVATVYIWFGGLKMVGQSPVAELVEKTVPPIMPKRISVPLIGAFEVLIGLGLLTRSALRLTLLLYFVQIVNTFLVLFRLPRRSFQEGNPFLLTQTGEFVIKNLVLLTAGLVIGSTVRRPSEVLPHRGDQEPEDSNA